MDLALEPELYAPVVNDYGNYIDKIPNFTVAGIRCPCNARSTVHKTRQLFVSHIKSKCHMTWLETLNANRSNYYTECEKLRALVTDQRKIIADMGNELAVLTNQNAELQQQLKKTHNAIDYLSSKRFSNKID